MSNNAYDKPKTTRIGHISIRTNPSEDSGSPRFAVYLTTGSAGDGGSFSIFLTTQEAEDLGAALTDHAEHWNCYVPPVVTAEERAEEERIKREEVRNPEARI